MRAIICDKCKKAIEEKEVGGKALIYAGFSWRGYGTKYHHLHFCKKCFEEVFGKFENIKKLEKLK